MRLRWVRGARNCVLHVYVCPSSKSSSSLYTAATAIAVCRLHHHRFDRAYGVPYNQSLLVFYEIQSHSRAFSSINFSSVSFGFVRYYEKKNSYFSLLLFHFFSSINLNESNGEISNNRQEAEEKTEKKKLNAVRTTGKFPIFKYFRWWIRILHLPSVLLLSPLFVIVRCYHEKNNFCFYCLVLLVHTNIDVSFQYVNHIVWSVWHCNWLELAFKCYLLSKQFRTILIGRVRTNASIEVVCVYVLCSKFVQCVLFRRWSGVFVIDLKIDQIMMIKFRCGRWILNNNKKPHTNWN